MSSTKLPNESAPTSKKMTKEKLENSIHHESENSLSFDAGLSHHPRVPASTTKLSQKKVFSANSGNHLKSHSSLPVLPQPANNRPTIMDTKHKLEKTHSGQINQKLTENHRNTKIPFSDNRHVIKPVRLPWGTWHYQSSLLEPGFTAITTNPSFLYNIISPTFGHLLSIPASKYGPILSNPHLFLYNNVIKHFPFYWFRK